MGSRCVAVTAVIVLLLGTGNGFRARTSPSSRGQRGQKLYGTRWDPPKKKAPQPELNPFQPQQGTDLRGPGGLAPGLWDDARFVRVQLPRATGLELGSDLSFTWVFVRELQPGGAAELSGLVLKVRSRCTSRCALKTRPRTCVCAEVTLVVGGSSATRVARAHGRPCGARLRVRSDVRSENRRISVFFGRVDARWLRWSTWEISIERRQISRLQSRDRAATSGFEETSRWLSVTTAVAAWPRLLTG
jgi:hypothetical protein